MVKLLLAKDGVDLDSKDKDGRTPLSLAARIGHEAVVKLLLAKDGVDPDSEDICGRTPLSYTAGNGHEAVVELLLAKDDVDPDSTNDEDRTPLSLAAGNGVWKCLELLRAMMAAIKWFSDRMWLNVRGKSCRRAEGDVRKSDEEAALPVAVNVL